jgi:porphobilinogen synthase
VISTLGMPYLDVIYRLKEATSLPIAAYHVSGEYAMLKAASQKVYISSYANYLNAYTVNTVCY